jgi:hypothetical protein
MMAFSRWVQRVAAALYAFLQLAYREPPGC